MDSPRSYILETPSGGQYRRNQSHILKSNDDSAQAEKMDSNVSNTTEQNSGENYSVKTKDETDNLYITRYGRQIKPVQRYGHNQ